MTRKSRIWDNNYKENTIESVRHSIINNLRYRLAKDEYTSTDYDRFLSTAYTVVERLVERWIATQQLYYKENCRRVYYLSMEYLLGRTLENSLINLGLYDVFKGALADLGLDLESVRNYEVDAGLGNGGLGRLAACFLDSMATLCLPAQGYGLRYEYGLFHQRISNGRQIEIADNWLARTNPWEIERPEYVFTVRFGGTVKQTPGPFGRQKTVWSGGEEVLAIPFDTPVPGYDVNNVNTLRLWSSKANTEFKFETFNIGDYISACEDKLVSENITKVLYPNDNFFEGKELRLKQEYFLVSASLQDIIRRFKVGNTNIKKLPEKVSIQLNDTHPALAIPELMRILLDEEMLDWNTAWDITTRVFSYTNHTVLPEALEEWPVPIIEKLLPRHLQIVYLINFNLLEKVSKQYPGDDDIRRRMSVFSENGQKIMKMAHLAIEGSHKVNGVAELHSNLIKEKLFNDFYRFSPEKFTNKTNGITPRRWIRASNPGLSALITDAIGDGWVKDLDKLRDLEKFADDTDFQVRWRETKFACKQFLSQTMWNEEWIEIPPGTMIDVLVKRIHEYKRQLMFALFIILKYLQIKESPQNARITRTCLIGGKAAPGYERAKLIIRFFNSIAAIVNNDPQVSQFLKVYFLPNYRVSLAEKIIPAADLSEQISMAGMEASGTGNMKFALNGAVTIGTLDGANVEIMEEVGQENIFIFGLKEHEVADVKNRGYDPQQYIDKSDNLKKVLNLIKMDMFSPGEKGVFKELYDELVYRDTFCLMADFDAYVAAQNEVETAYRDKKRWTRMSILNTARCGKFSSDRTIQEYAEEIWQIGGVPVDMSAKE